MTAADAGPRFVPPADRLVPTAEQQAIQGCTAPTLLVQARAGAAKTTTLALRLAEALSKGTRPEHCLVLTYTPAACEAFRAALEHVGIPGDAWQRLVISTFEDFAAGVLRAQEGVAVPRLLEPEQLRAEVDRAVAEVAEAVGRDEERWPEALEYPSPGDASFVAEFLDDMLWLKGTLALQPADGDDDDDGLGGPERAEALGRRYMSLRTFAAYERLRAGGNPDRPLFRGPFDATYDLARLLGQERRQGLEPAGTGWPERLRVLLVDEMHDMNQAMFELLRQLLRRRGLWFTGVGDADQVIHAASGADAAFLHERIACDTGRAITRLPLATSFRYGPALAGAASRLIDKPLQSAGLRATEVAAVAYGDDADCAGQVLQDVAQWRRDRRRAASALAVLLRHEHHSIGIENALVDADIAYRTVGFESYLLRPEVLLVRGLLAIVLRDFASLEGRDTLSRVVQAFMLFCGTRFDPDPERPGASQSVLMQEALRHIQDNAEILPLYLENHVLRQAAPGVARRLRAAMDAAGGADGADAPRAPGGSGPERFERFLAALDMPWFVAQALVQPERRAHALRNLAGLRALAGGYDSTPAFFAHLNETAARRARMPRQKAVVLASVEAVKGLEFEQVLLPFLQQGEFPDRHGRAGDEDNLFYVAITRARSGLRLYAPRQRPSEYLARMGLSADGALPAA